MENSYWNSRGTYQDLYDKLRPLIPISGEVDGKNNKALERLRKAANVYYDVFNNGLCNRGKQFYGVFKFAASNFKRTRYDRDYRGRMVTRQEIMFDRIARPMDERMDEIILAAAKEQGIVQ